MLTSKPVLLPLALASLALSVVLPNAARAARQKSLRQWYQTEAADIPLLVFCSGNPSELGTKFIVRNKVEYLPLAEYGKREEDLKKYLSVYLIAREQLMEIPPEYRAFIPQLDSLKPNHLYIFSETANPRCKYNYRTADGKVRSVYEQIRLVIIAPTVAMLEDDIGAVMARPDFPHQLAKGKNARFPCPVLAEARMVCAIADKGKGAVDAYLAAPGPGPAPGVPARIARFDAAPAEMQRLDKWLPMSEEVYALTYDELAGLPDSVRQRIPYDVTRLAANQTVALRKSREGLPPVTCFIAPTANLLQALVKSSASGSVPSAPQVKTIADMRHVKTVLVTVLVTAASREQGSWGNLPELIERMVADTLSHARLFDGVRAGQGEGGELSSVLKEIKLQATGITEDSMGRLAPIANANALLLVTITRAEGRSTYGPKDTRLTPEPAAFSEGEPKKPSLDDTRGILGGHKYTVCDANGQPSKDGSRANDPQFKRDLDKWEKDVAAWRQRRDEYERKVRSMEYEWKLQVVRSSIAEVEATVSVFDLEKKGAVIWSVPLKGKAEDNGVEKEEKEVTTGSASKPSRRLEVPKTGPCSPDLLVKAAKEAVRGLAQAMRDNVLLPGELPADIEAATPENAVAVATAPAGGTGQSGGGEKPKKPTPAADSGKPTEQAAPEVKDAIGTILDLEQGTVTIKAMNSNLKAGAIVVAVVSIEVKKDKDGTVLDTEENTVFLRVVKGRTNTADCVPVKADDLAKLKVDMPVRLPREGEAAPEAPPKTPKTGGTPPAKPGTRAAPQPGGARLSPTKPKPKPKAGG